MSNRDFTKYAGISTILAILGVFFFDFVLGKDIGLSFNLISILILLIFCAGMYYISISASKNSNKHLFSGITLVSIFVKIVLILAMLLIYTRIFTPDSRYFLLPFIFTYIVFTIFETYFLILNAKKDSQG